MDHYRDNLRHVIRPEKPSDRMESDRILLSNYEALYLRQQISNWAAYYADTEEAEAIALAYVDYIDMVVHDEREPTLHLYAHTDVAKDVLRGVSDELLGEPFNIHDSVAHSIDTLK